MQLHLLIFQTSTVGRFSYLPLHYYLSTCCGGPSFMLAYLCRRYFWGLIIIFFRCNLDFQQNGPFTLHQQRLGHVPSLKSSLSFDSPNIMQATNNQPPPPPLFLTVVKQIKQFFEMLKVKVFSNTIVNALTSTKKKNPTSLVLKKTLF